jgi:hypothetical protein
MRNPIDFTGLSLPYIAESQLLQGLDECDIPTDLAVGGMHKVYILLLYIYSI